MNSRTRNRSPPFPETHWFHQARALGGLYLQFKKGGRIERFLTYDLELQTTLPIRLDGGPDQYKIANLGKHKLHDILLIVPVEGGRRVGWLDAANLAEVAQPARSERRQCTFAVSGPGESCVGQPRQTNPAGQPTNKETLTDISSFRTA